MKVALIDSGLGMLPTAGWLRHLDPGLDLLLSLDPDGSPWGPKPAAFITERLLAAGEEAVGRGAGAIVVPCNTATVTAIDSLRARFEPGIPVIGTVPAIKPAAAAGRPMAVWATVRTTASAYQDQLIADFAPGLTVTRVACPGLAEAVDLADREAIIETIALATKNTPAECASVVLGCTHYPLVATEILQALPPNVTLYDSAEAIARQTLRRLPKSSHNTGSVEVLLSNRPGALPEFARAYPAGRALADGSLIPEDALIAAVTRAL